MKFYNREVELAQVEEFGNFKGLEKIVTEDYNTYSGKTFELYFKQMK